MSRIEELERMVRELYTARPETRADFADWMYASHVFQVADETERLAKIYGANPELARAAGMLHDIADAVTKREDAGHDEKSREIAREFLAKANFTPEEIEVVVEDALRYHSCKNEERPQTAEGKVMAAADASVHLTTDFYEHFARVFKERGEKDSDIKEWTAEKTLRDFTNKIPFKDLQESVRPHYEAIRSKFGIESAV